MSATPEPMSEERLADIERLATFADNLQASRDVPQLLAEVRRLRALFEVTKLCVQRGEELLLERARQAEELLRERDQLKKALGTFAVDESDLDPAAEAALEREMAKSAAILDARRAVVEAAKEWRAADEAEAQDAVLDALEKVENAVDALEKLEGGGESAKDASVTPEGK